MVSNSSTDFCISMCRWVSISSTNTIPGILKSKDRFVFFSILMIISSMISNTAANPLDRVLKSKGFLPFSLIWKEKSSSSNISSRESSLNIFRSNAVKLSNHRPIAFAFSIFPLFLASASVTLISTRYFINPSRGISFMVYLSFNSTFSMCFDVSALKIRSAL